MITVFGTLKTISVIYYITYMMLNSDLRVDTVAYFTYPEECSLWRQRSHSSRFSFRFNVLLSLSVESDLYPFTGLRLETNLLSILVSVVFNGMLTDLLRDSVDGFSTDLHRLFLTSSFFVEETVERVVWVFRLGLIDEHRC